jgi:hypothetical protein
VALGDVNGDGYDDIIVSTNAAGNGRVKVYDGKLAITAPSSVNFSDTVTNPQVLLGVVCPFAPGLVGSANTYKGGISVASADVNNDGFDDVICGTLNGQGQVVVLDGSHLHQQIGATITPFGTGYTNGIQVASGDLDGDGFAEVLVGTSRNRSRVKGYSLVGSSFFQSIATMTPFTDGPNGVRLGILDVQGDNKLEFAVGSLDSVNTLTVKIFSADSSQLSVFPAGTGVANYALAGLDPTGTGVNSLMIGTVPLSGATRGGTNQVSIVNPLTGVATGGFDAFAMLVGNVALGGV